MNLDRYDSTGGSGVSDGAPVSRSESAFRVPFHRPCLTGGEVANVGTALASGELSAGGPFTAHCEEWLSDAIRARQVFLTTSCTSALEVAALVSGITAGDEVIVPSFTFPSTANAFALRGAMPVFVDIRPDTLCLDESLIESAITPKTRAIAVTHYGGAAADMQAIRSLADRHGLCVVEDAAHALHVRIGDAHVGTFGAFGALSFHDTKNTTSGEGGALIVNDASFAEAVEIAMDKGTDRRKFRRGEVTAYAWQQLGGAHGPPEIVAACLLAQLQGSEEATRRRLVAYGRYHDSLAPLEEMGVVARPAHWTGSRNAHTYYLITRSATERMQLAAHLRARGIDARPHYEPLHTSPFGSRVGRAGSALTVTEETCARLLRLPLFPDLSEAQQREVVAAVESFYVDARSRLSDSSGG